MRTDIQKVPEIPLCVAETPLSRKLEEHLGPARRGKVRNTHDLPRHPDHLLVVATDRVSANDSVLPVLIPGKGFVLNNITVFWMTGPLAGFSHHLIAFGRHVDRFLPPALRNNPELQRRAVVVKRLTMMSGECVVRGYLSGSAWKECQATGSVCGIEIPPGLNDGSKLVEPLFTPTTKSEGGHDEPILLVDFVKKFGKGPGDLSVEIFTIGREYAAARGMILADTKFEFGVPYSGSLEINWRSLNKFRLVLGDEVFTPDSSRYWSEAAWEESQSNADPVKRRSPPGFDKQYVRDTMTAIIKQKLGKNPSDLDPENPEDRRWVQENVILTPEVIEKTAGLYRTCHELLIGKNLEDYQESVLGCVPYL